MIKEQNPMLKYKKSMQLEEDEPGIDISSLIDVCFLLLIYFIVTSTIAEPESDLILQLPTPKSEIDQRSIIEPAFFVVLRSGQIQQIAEDSTASNIDGVGKTRLDGGLAHRNPEDLLQLNRCISAYATISGDQAMIKVKAEKETKAQYVIDFLNVLAKNNISKITFTEHLD
jgi:biopolymer transport protein ExbD